MRRGRMLRARGGVDSSAAARAGGCGGDRLPAFWPPSCCASRTRGQGDLHHSPSGSFGLPSQSLTRPRGRLRIKQCAWERREGREEAAHTNRASPTTSLSSARETMSKRPREEEHQSHCAECRKSGGALLCCDACPRSFHLKCIGLSGMPLDDWFCATCVRLKAKESISPSPPQSAPAVQIRADSPADLTASVSTSLVSLASSAQQSSPGHERALLAVQQCGEALRKELEAELSHVASELAAQPTRRAEAQAAVARLQANGAAMLQRSEDLKRLLHNLERIPPAEGQDKAPPALPAPSAGAARPTLMGNAASAAAAAPPAASSAVSGSFGRALSRPGRARTVAVWHTVCMRHCPPPSCPEQPARLRAVVNVLEELAAAHPSLLALVTSTAEVSASSSRRSCMRPTTLHSSGRCQRAGSRR